MTPQEMWNDYSKNSNIKANYEAWAFCGGGKEGDKLAELVLQGQKTATASAFIAYKKDEKIPKRGDYSVVLFDDGTPACIIQDTSVTIVPFNKVPSSHAYKEGEGDRSLAYWREAHKRAFTPDYKENNLPFDEEGLIVLEEFKVVYKP